MNKKSKVLKRFLCLLPALIFVLFSPIFDRVVGFFLDNDIPLIIIYPVDNQVRGLMPVNLFMFDNSEPLNISIHLNNQEIKYTSPLLIDTTKFPDGDYSLVVEVNDSSIRKNRAVNAVNFVIDNTPPSVEIVLEKEILEPGGVIQGRINLTEKASIEAKIDGEHLILLETEPADTTNIGSNLMSFFFIYGIPLGEEPSVKEMSVEAVDEVGNKATKLISYNLRDRKFITEYLKIAEEKTPLLDVKLLREERKIVEEVLIKVSKEIYWEGNFIPPVNSVVTSPFGYKRIYNQGLLIDQHKGIDYRAKEGTSVKASNSGLVVLSEFLKARGGTIIIDHGLGAMSLYCHLQEMMVKKGDSVKKGQFIGKAGDTGITTAPHLHFEMRIRNVAIDPNHFYDER